MISRSFPRAGMSAVLAITFAASTVPSVAFAQAKAPAKPAAAAAKPAAPAAKPAAAPAKPKPNDKKAAGAAFKAGKDAFDKKEWAKAKEQFSIAEETLPAAAAEYYLGRCEEELGNGAEAVKWFDKALGGKLKDDQAADAKSRTEALKKKPVKVKVTSDPSGATILVDGKALTEKTPADIELPPGSHKITVQAAGKKDSEQTVEVAAFTPASVDAKLEAAPAAGPAEDPFAKKPEVKPEEKKPAETPKTVTIQPKDYTWVYVTGGLAIVGLGVGTVFGLQAMSQKSKFDDEVAAGNRAGATDARDKGTRNALISDMGFGIGITLAVTCAVLYFTSPDDGKAEEKKAAKSTTTWTIAPVIGTTPNGKGVSTAGAAALIRF